MHTPAVGIVAEYNPFHLGHQIHIQKARELSGADAVVVALSSNFVQRGEPAMLDKWTRAAAALACGADLVLELPVVFSSHNAGAFAGAAVDILGATGVVSSLSFGVESTDWDMHKVIDILIEEPEPFKTSLKIYLEKGYSFVQARSKAVDDIIPGSAERLRGSNNTLAVSYMTRIRQKGWKMTSLPVLREGSLYNDGELSDLSSAAAIRAAISHGRINEALAQTPPKSAKILSKAIADGRACVNMGRFWPLLRAILLHTGAEEISQLAEISEGIEYKLKSAALTAKSFEEWTGACTCRRYPAGRIRRHGIHIMLGLKHWDNRAFQRLGPAYIRPLAMNETGRRLMREMKTTASLPVVTKCGAAANVSDYASGMMDYELRGGELWEEMIPCGRYGAEHTQKVIMA